MMAAITDTLTSVIEKPHHLIRQIAVELQYRPVKCDNFPPVVFRKPVLRSNAVTVYSRIVEAPSCNAMRKRFWNAGSALHVQSIATGCCTGIVAPSTSISCTRGPYGVRSSHAFFLALYWDALELTSGIPCSLTCWRSFAMPLWVTREPPTRPKRSKRGRFDGTDDIAMMS